MGWVGGGGEAHSKQSLQSTDFFFTCALTRFITEGNISSFFFYMLVKKQKKTACSIIPINRI